MTNQPTNDDPIPDGLGHECHMPTAVLTHHAEQLDKALCGDESAMRAVACNAVIYRNACREALAWRRMVEQSRSDETRSVTSGGINLARQQPIPRSHFEGGGGDSRLFRDPHTMEPRLPHGGPDLAGIHQQDD